MRLLQRLWNDLVAAARLRHARRVSEAAMSEYDEADKVAAEIAERLGETEEGPREQIRRIARETGPAFVRTAADASTVARSELGVPGLRECLDGAPRTIGGVFFVVARKMCSGEVAAGRLDRKAFYRLFVAHMGRKTPPTPRPPKGPPASKQKRAPQAQRPAHASPSNDVRRIVSSRPTEVYVRRGR